MKLKDFAELSGVSLIRCEPEWGGTYGYRLSDSPNVAYCGYKSALATYQGWANATFGPAVVTALRKLGVK